VYGEAFLLTHAQAMGDALAFAKEDRKYDFDAVVVGSFPIVSNLILSLYQDPKWALIYLDGTDVVFLKDKPGLRPVLEKYRIDFKKGFYSPIPRDLTGAWLASERSERGFLLNMLGQLQWALPDFEAAVELEPENPEHNYDLGWTLNMLGRFSEALPYLEKAASREPEMAAYQIQLARACAMSGQVNRAEDLYLQILQRNPLEIKACADLANFYEQMKQDRGRALEQWLKCRQIYLADPKASRFAREISSALDRLGNKK
jgi:tetratricopeptide (TPR) repeat protein